MLKRAQKMWELSNCSGPSASAGLFTAGDQLSLTPYPANRVYSQGGNLDYYITRSLLTLQWGAAMCRHSRVARDLWLLASGGSHMAHDL
jgi:hypothetical protein